MRTTDDDLLATIHALLQQVGNGTTDTLLELLQRVVAVEALTMQLMQSVRALRLLVWGMIAVEGMFVLLLVIATVAQIVRGGP